jgi:hypothetical protein
MVPDAPAEPSMDPPGTATRRWWAAPPRPPHRPPPRSTASSLPNPRIQVTAQSFICLALAGRV